VGGVGGGGGGGGGGLSTGNFERRMKGALGMEHLSLKRLCGEGLGGSCIGDPLQWRGIWRGGHIPGTLKDE